VSVRWQTDHFGYDGDFVHGHVVVNYWQDKASMLAAIDAQAAQIRAAAESEWARLTGAETPKGD
jgi:hypothetical protein